MSEGFAEIVEVAIMTQVLTQRHIDQLRHIPEDLDLRIGAMFKAPSEELEEFIIIGTGARWEDIAFGITASPQAIVRSWRERMGAVCNVLRAELYAKELDRWAAESGTMDHLVGEVPDSEIERYEPRDIPESQATQEILDHLAANPNLDAYDVALALNLDPASVFDICHRLVEEGRLEFAENSPSD